MLDIKWIRENKEEFNDLLLKRGVEVNTEEIIKLDEEKRRRECVSPNKNFSK